MTREEQAALYETWEKKRVISMSDLKDKSDRTLIYGYTLDRSTYHVYIKNGLFNVICYSERLNGGKYINGRLNEELVYPEHCIPSKRVYPRHSDFEFCKLIKEFGFDIPFTIFEDQEDRIPYAGLTYEDLKKS